MSEIFTEQLGVVANVVLAVFAIVTAVLAGLAFRKQAREVRDQAEMLELQRRQLAEQEKTSAKQAEELELQRRQFERDQFERRRAQASLVFVWTERGYDERYPGEESSGNHDTLTVYVTNTSQQPVYDVTISWYQGDSPWDSSKDEQSVLMPGSQFGVTRYLPPLMSLPAGKRRFGGAASFRDASGVRWALTPTGQLTEEPGEGA